MGPAYTAEPLETPRLTLRPLTVEDAQEMATVLADERLHEFIGGEPLNAVALAQRYAHLVRGSGRPEEAWLNWVVRLRADLAAVGTLQATVSTVGSPQAHIAWVVGVRFQRRGFASEATLAMIDWLASRGVSKVVARIHPLHHASEGVARNAGLTPTDAIVDGERVWTRG